MKIDLQLGDVEQLTRSSVIDRLSAGYGFRAMRTNVGFDDALMAEAMAVSGLATKHAVVEEACGS
jgi:hypothetical protein